MDMKVTFPGGKRVNAELYDEKGEATFVIATDQSIKSGGDGSAPEPYSYFLASIGTCAGIYVLSFCKKNDISTEGLEILQHHEFSPDDQGKVRLGKLTIKIMLPSGFPEKYLDAIIRVADQCAVKKTIANPPEFEVTAAINK